MAKVKVIVINRKRRIRAVILPPGASTGRHLEKEDYDVVPFTSGTMKVEIFESARAAEPDSVEVRKLTPYVAYPRKVGPRGKYINATNLGHNPPANKNTIIFVKGH